MQDKKENYVNTAISGAAYETIQRYGSAVKEHLVAYSGIDNEKEISSSVMKKSLKSIKEQKTNSDYEYSIKQQKAGWAAATNATLAFFGGGSLAAGGLGMAGGTAVLGGLVAGPALAVLGFVAGAKASKNLEMAKANLAKAKEFEEEMRTVADLCNGIRRRAAMFNRFLIRLQTVFDPLVFEMTQIIEKTGNDYRNYSENEKKCIASAMSMAGAIKAVLDTPILDEDGNLTQDSGLVIENLCAIYEKRPIICNVSKMFELVYSSWMTEEDYWKLNFEGCKKLKRDVFKM